MLKFTFLPFLNILGFNTKIIEAFEKKYVILGQFPLCIQPVPELSPHMCRQ
jgi:hypothetical protein